MFGSPISARRSSQHSSRVLVVSNMLTATCRRAAFW
jgi:hypothetical protein